MFLARNSEGEDLWPLYALSCGGDEVAVSPGVVTPQEILNTASAQDELAYVLGVIAGCPRFATPNPLLMARAEPEIVERVRRWAELADVPYDIAASPVWWGERHDDEDRRDLVLYAAEVRPPSEAVVPSWVMGGTLAMMQAYLQGLVDRWAMPDQDGTITLTLPNDQLRSQVQLLLLAPFGIVASKQPHDRGQYPLMIRRPMAGQLMRTIGFSVQRKIDQVRSWVGSSVHNAAVDDPPLILWQTIKRLACTGRRPLMTLNGEPGDIVVINGITVMQPHGRPGC